MVFWLPTPKNKHPKHMPKQHPATQKCSIKNNLKGILLCPYICGQNAHVQSYTHKITRQAKILAQWFTFWCRQSKTCVQTQTPGRGASYVPHSVVRRYGFKPLAEWCLARPARPWNNCYSPSIVTAIFASVTIEGVESNIVLFSTICVCHSIISWHFLVGFTLSVTPSRYVSLV